MPDSAKWVWLSEALYKGTHRAKVLLEHFKTIEAVYSADKATLLKNIPSLKESEISSLSSKSLTEAERILQKCREKGIRVITPDSVEYPERLKNISNPPTVLYAKGKMLCPENEAPVAIVGTRNATREGEAAATKLGREISQIGGTVVTGLARGVDSVAAGAVLDVGGKVIAVLGCGVDICYPPENRRLMARVIENGTVVSEYPPETRPERRNFPTRNRIISGLSLGTVVVQAGEKSGALITAEYAIEQNRDVFTVPFDIFNKMAKGSNALLREGAIPVTSGRDVMSEYESLYGEKLCFEIKEEQTEDRQIKAQGEFIFPDGYLDKFSEDEKKILCAIKDEEIMPDEIFKRCNFAPERALSLLTLLEIKRAVSKIAGNKFKLSKF